MALTLTLNTFTLILTLTLTLTLTQNPEPICNPNQAPHTSKHTRRCVHAQPTHAAPSTHRYASLYFMTCVDEEDNELVGLETIHHFVEVYAS